MQRVETRGFLKETRVLTLVLLSLTVFFHPRSGSAQQHYKQTNLTSAKAGVAPVTDPNLVNPWGLSRSSTGAWWVADETTGLSTLYDGTGKVVPLVVKIPPANSSIKKGSPTGTVFNGGSGFQITPNHPASFLFVTEDGTISAWNGGSTAIIKVNENGKSVYMGATIASGSGKTLLYVADVKQAKVQVFSTSFAPVAISATAFEDPAIPNGYAPFNVQNIGGNIYVAFGRQNSAKNFVDFGAGLGFVSAFSPSGVFLSRLQPGSYFNAPWGLVQASGDFGVYSHDILVGEFGTGQIQAFDPLTGAKKGSLVDSTGAVLAIPGLWALSFGNGSGAGSATAMYFTAAADLGLFGTITPIENIQGNDQ